MDFNKEGIVSVWYSTVDYSSIPNSYFEEDEQGLDQWARNFQIPGYDPENMETNGCETGLADAATIITPCSWSGSWGEPVVKKIAKLGDNKISWLVLMFDFEYRAKKTKIFDDEYVRFVGCFPYNSDAGELK